VPGAPILVNVPSYQGVMSEGVPQSAVGAPASGLGWSFWIWLVVIGVVIPAAILGGLRAGGFQFVFRRR
jgi:hypothetical protein